MKDLSLELENRPGALAHMGEVLGAAGVSLEGGGMFVHNGMGYGHFLVGNAALGKQVLEAHGMKGVVISEVIRLKLQQKVPGQLGLICRQMQRAGVNILVQYSDHDHHLVLVVDDYQKGKAVASNWERNRS